MDPEPVDPRLDEAILAEPESPEPRRVLADFLEERGHWRAEWIRLTLSSTPGRHYAVDAAQHAYLERHDTMLRGMPTYGFDVQWFGGYVYSVNIWKESSANLDALTRVMAQHRSYRFLQTLAVSDAAFRFDAARPPQSLRHVELADVPQMLTSLVRSPLLRSLESLRLARLTEEAAAILLEASPHPDLELRTRREAISAATRDAIARALPRWHQDKREGLTATSAPRYAPATFASMPPITHETSWALDEWIGSGVSVYGHPMGTHGGASCYACLSTNTLVVWAKAQQSEWDGKRFTHNDYELRCRDCGKFSVYTHEPNF